MTINLTVKDLSTSRDMVGAAVYLWHCDRDGNYSMYSQGTENENYLRGVQQTDETGTASFSSIFPAANSGRWPHIHFEVYRSVAGATASGPIVKSSQIGGRVMAPGWGADSRLNLCPTHPTVPHGAAGSLGV